MTRDVSAIRTQALKTLRELELYLKFFNLCFADVLWGLKLFLLTSTIFGGFAAIRIIHTKPVLGCFYAYLSLAHMVLYIGMFQFAYKVTEKLDGLTKLMKIVSVGLVSSEERKYWARVLRSIPRMEMSLGGFSRVEREAVPIFIDFCVKEMVSLLLAIN